MTRPIVWIFGSALTGAAAAITTTVVLNRLHAESNRPVDVPSIQPSPQGESNIVTHVTNELGAAQLAAMKHDIEELQRERQATAHPDEPKTAPDPAEERRHVEQRFTDLARRLATDPVDPAWSRSASELLRTDLSAEGAKGGFILRATECKTEMCRATVEWKNYDSAVQAGLHLPEHTVSGLNCTTSIWLKEPEKGASGPYSADLYFDCSQQRAGQVP